MDRVILRGMRACLICMPYMYVARDRCTPYLYFLYDCLICDRVVFRGMSGVTLPECFEVAKEGGGAGGVDFGFVSTTTDRKVAVAYLGGKAMPSINSQKYDAL